MNKRLVGSDKEELACEYLKKHGYRIVSRNFRCRAAEIDIIAYDNDVLSFIEVKYRKSKELGDPAEAVGANKQRKIYEAALYYILRFHVPDNTNMRFDVVAILGADIRLYKNAFTLN